MTNNLARTELTTNQVQKEVAINNSDGVLDAAITADLSVVFAGAEALKTITATQMRNAVRIKVTGSTSEANPVLKTANVQRGFFSVHNQLAQDLTVEDYGSVAADIIVPSGSIYVLFGNADGNFPIVRGGAPVFTIALEPSVRAATTANITLSGAQTIDGVSVIAGDRVLVKNQTTGSENGVYTAAAGAWSRASATWGQGTAFAVDEGTTNGSKIWMLTTPPPIVIGTTSLAFVAISASLLAMFTSLTDTPSSYTGHAGKVVAVNVTEDGLEFVAISLTAKSWKDSVRLATTGNITLFDEQTIDGVAAVDGDRVLVKNQTTGTENGVYDVVASGTWVRSSDQDDSAKIFPGQVFSVEEGTDNGGKLFMQRTLLPILLGTSTLVFSLAGGAGSGGGSTYWKDGCRAATTANITISTQLNSGDTIDGVTLANGDRVLVKNQSTASENGVYVVSATPARADDFDQAAEVRDGVAVAVAEGTVNADTAWRLVTSDPITVGSTNLVFAQTAPKRFVDLSDVPSSYSGHGRKLVRVNAAGNGLEFVDHKIDIGGFFGGAPGSSIITFAYLANDDLSFAASVAGSRVQAKTAATAQADFDLRKNNVSVGTIRFAAAGTVASYVSISAFTLAAGDLLEVVSPASPDATLANIFFNLRAVRAS